MVAKVTAVGRPLTSSAAKLGPDITPKSLLESSGLPNTSKATSCGSFAVPSSSPLFAQIMEALLLISLTSINICLKADVGTTDKIKSELLTAFDKLSSSSNCLGKLKSPRYFGLLRAFCMPDICDASLAQRAT